MVKKAFCSSDVLSYLLLERFWIWPLNLRSQPFQERDLNFGLLVERNRMEV